MNNTIDKEAEQRKDDLIDQLILHEVYVGMNNRQLYELRVSELEQMYRDVKGVAVND